MNSSNYRSKIILTFVCPFLIVFLSWLPIMYRQFYDSQITYYTAENLLGLEHFRAKMDQYSRQELDSILQSVKVISWERLTVTDPQGHILAGDSIPYFDYSRAHYEGVMSTRWVGGTLYTIIHVSDSDGYTHWDIAPHFRSFFVVYKSIFLLLLAGLFCITISLLIFRFHLAPRINSLVASDARMKTELHIAHGLQQAMVTHGLLDNVDATLTPAREVGGDLYDYVWVGERLYFCIGDVSDKGVASAMAMAITRSLFHQTAELCLPLWEIVSQINHTSSENNASCMFCTLFAGCINMNTLKMEYINCGHCAPIVLSPNREPWMLDIVPNVSVGVIDHFDFQSQSVQLTRGDVLLLYTDGVIEAMNAHYEQFGNERLVALLKTADVSQHTAIIPNIMQSLADFRGQAEQNDDITLMTINLCDVDRLHYDVVRGKTVQIVEDVLRQVNRADDLRLRLVIEEIVNNIAAYAYEQDGPLDITTHVASASDKSIITIEIADSGQPFDPLRKELPNINASLEERQVGGLGIFLARQMATMSYRYENNENHLTLTYEV